jgi:heme/copper-type cytochrome/quinol oxidase subunit 3
MEKCCCGEWSSDVVKRCLELAVENTQALVASAFSHRWAHVELESSARKKQSNRFNSSDAKEWL